MADRQKNQVEQVYRKSRELETILDELNVVVLIVDSDFRLKRVNKTAREFAEKKKYSQLLNKKCHLVFFNKKQPCEFCPRNRVDATLKALRASGFRPVQEINTSFDARPLGRSRYFEQKQYVIEGPDHEELLVEMLTDISDQREFEEEQVRNAKLIALGTAVQTVAHELGNPLTGMRLTLEGLMKKELEAPLRKRLELLQNDLARANHVVSEISSYTRRQGYRLVPVEIFKVIKNVISDLKRISNFKFHCNFNWQADKKLKIMAHEQKLMQVFHNLVQNSLQAFKIQMQRNQKLEPNLWIGAQLNQKGRADDAEKLLEVQVIDNAGGIPKEVIARIFDPFFTTRRGMNRATDQREGSGLGLFITHKILEEHNATIEVDSKGAYTRFSIFFPVDDELI